MINRFEVNLPDTQPSLLLRIVRLSDLISIEVRGHAGSHHRCDAINGSGRFADVIPEGL
jgi:hypothetical protein